MISSTSRMVPTSRLRFAQSSCVTPPGLSMKIRSMRALPDPFSSTSTTSNPLETATRSTTSRTWSISNAMNTVSCRGTSAQTPQRKSGLSPTGVFRQTSYYTTVPFTNIPCREAKDKPASGQKMARWRRAFSVQDKARSTETSLRSDGSSAMSGSGQVSPKHGDRGFRQCVLRALSPGLN
jgi:hypothetical protein